MGSTAPVHPVDKHLQDHCCVDLLVDLSDTHSRDSCAAFISPNRRYFASLGNNRATEFPVTQLGFDLHCQVKWPYVNVIWVCCYWGLEPIVNLPPDLYSWLPSAVASLYLIDLLL